MDLARTLDSNAFIVRPAERSAMMEASCALRVRGLPFEGFVALPPQSESTDEVFDRPRNLALILAANSGVPRVGATSGSSTAPISSFAGKEDSGEAEMTGELVLLVLARMGLFVPSKLSRSAPSMPMDFLLK